MLLAGLLYCGAGTSVALYRRIASLLLPTAAECNRPLGILMDLMTPLFSRLGPELNRDTVGSFHKAGFRLRRAENAHLDVVKTTEAVKDGGAR